MISILDHNVIYGSSTLIIDTASGSTKYFSKGHLSPKYDFVYKSMQQATYYFLNSAPQFREFDSGNWDALEDGIIDYAIA